MDKTYYQINRLIILRNMMETIIDNAITDCILVDKDVDVEDVKVSLDYVIEDNLTAFKQGR